MPAPNFYAELEVDRTATSDEVRAAYRRLAAQCHPDNQKTGDAARFRRIREAYEVLVDPARRAKYDATGYVDPRFAEQLAERLAQEMSAGYRAWVDGDRVGAAAHAAQGIATALGGYLRARGRGAGS